MRFSFCIALTLLLSSVLYAEIQTKKVEYRDGEVLLEGYAAWDDSKVEKATAGKLPGILIVHQWMGLTEYEEGRAKQLAELGYVVFVLDIYGKGVRPADTGEAGKLAGKFKSDRMLYRRRLNSGLDQLRKLDGVDGSKLAAIGYCFGGTGVLELARSGAEIEGGVSFHGGLDSPTPEDGKNIKAKLLICHGAYDPFVPKSEMEAMIREFDQAKVNWQMNVYSGAVHSFTQPMAGNDPSRGAAYNEQADKRSWEAMKTFFDELFSS